MSKELKKQITSEINKVLHQQVVVKDKMQTQVHLQQMVVQVVQAEEVLDQVVQDLTKVKVIPLL